MNLVSYHYHHHRGKDFIDLTMNVPGYAMMYVLSLFNVSYEVSWCKVFCVEFLWDVDCPYVMSCE